MRRGVLRGLTAGIGVTVAASLAAAAPAQAAARSSAPAAKRVGPLLLAWGDNFDGELGDGTVMDRNAPVAVNPPAGLKATSARVGSFAAAVTPSGQLMAWGRGTEGELGNGAMKDRHRPVEVKLPKGVRIKAVRVGIDFAVAVTTTGRVYAWGIGTSGQLGNGERKSSDLPVRVDLPRGVQVKAVSAGANSAIALTSTGRVLAWGDNHEGQLGNGRTRTSRQAGLGQGSARDQDHRGGRRRRPDVRSHRVGPAAGLGKQCVVRSRRRQDGHQASAGSRSAAEERQGRRRTSAGCVHSLAVTAGGRVLAWGDNEGGQLGDGTLDEPQAAGLRAHSEKRTDNNARRRALFQPGADQQGQGLGVGR